MSASKPPWPDHEAGKPPADDIACDSGIGSSCGATVGGIDPARRG
jgi:hypothetical protein